MTDIDTDLTASDIAWDLEGLLDGAPDPDALMDEAERLAEAVETEFKGRIADLDGPGLSDLFSRLARVVERTNTAANTTSTPWSSGGAAPQR